MKKIVKSSYVAKLYSEEEIEKLLVDYELIDKEKLCTLPKGCGIRYYTKDGIFKRGGYISSASVSGKPRNINGTIICNTYLRLQSNKHSAGLQWMVDYNRIEKIYKEKDHINELEDKTKELEERISILENIIADITGKKNMGGFGNRGIDNSGVSTSSVCSESSYWTWEETKTS